MRALLVGGAFGDAGSSAKRRRVASFTQSVVDGVEQAALAKIRGMLRDAGAASEGPL